MFSTDIPSFLIGAGLVATIWVLHYVYWPKKSSFVPTECLRKAGSRKGDEGVWTKNRCKRCGWALHRETDGAGIGGSFYRERVLEG